MQPLSIRYNRVMAIAFVVVGVLLLVLSVLTQQWISVLAGAVLALLGVLMVVNPMIRIESHEVQMRNPVGMTLRRHPLTSPEDLALDGKALRHLPTGKRIATLAFGAHGPDVEALRAQLSAPR